MESVRHGLVIGASNFPSPSSLASRNAQITSQHALVTGPSAPMCCGSEVSLKAGLLLLRPGLSPSPAHFVFDVTFLHYLASPHLFSDKQKCHPTSHRQFLHLPFHISDPLRCIFREPCLPQPQATKCKLKSSYRSPCQRISQVLRRRSSQYSRCVACPFTNILH